MRNAFLILAVLIAVTLMAPAGASAHVLKIDGNIGAVLHIKPDDAAVSGQPTTYTLEFDDASGHFRLSDCTCTIRIQAAGKQVTRTLRVTSQATAQDTYTFPQPAVYTLQVHGQPTHGNSFQPFTLNYEVRVAGDNATGQPIPPLLWIGLGLTIGLVLLAAFRVE